jgi:hypothetical protein
MKLFGRGIRQREDPQRIAGTLADSAWARHHLGYGNGGEKLCSTSGREELLSEVPDDELESSRIVRFDHFSCSVLLFRCVGVKLPLFELVDIVADIDRWEVVHIDICELRSLWRFIRSQVYLEKMLGSQGCHSVRWRVKFA